VKTSIIILTQNNLPYTKLCIGSIRSYTDPETYELIVIDNHSTDGTVEWLQQQEDIKTICNEENLGFPKGCNQGIQSATGDAILLLNNDTIVTPNWLKNLLTCLHSADDIGAVGAVTNYCSNYQVIPTSYTSIQDMLRFAQEYNVSDPTKWEERLRLIGYCMLIRRSVVDKVGLLDEQFSPGNFEDDDYSLRIRKAGYRLLLCKDVFIHHFGSMSFRKKVDQFENLLAKNRQKFQEKWGYDPYYTAEIRKDITALIQQRTHRGQLNLLHIGCQGGATLLDIKHAIPSANLYGIEPCRETIVNTEHFATISIGGIEQIKKFQKGFFDFILYTGSGIPIHEYVHHMDEIIQYVKEDGELLASIRKPSH
jgi:GT2 family glycosyltransferase